MLAPNRITSLLVALSILSRDIDARIQFRGYFVIFFFQIHIRAASIDYGELMREGKRNNDRKIANKYIQALH